MRRSSVSWLPYSTWLAMLITRPLPLPLPLTLPPPSIRKLRLPLSKLPLIPRHLFQSPWTITTALLSLAPLPLIILVPPSLRLLLALTMKVNLTLPLPGGVSRSGKPYHFS